MERATFLKILQAQGFKQARKEKDSRGHEVLIYEPTDKHKFALIGLRFNKNSSKISKVSVHYDSKVVFHYKLIHPLASDPKGTQIYKLFYDDMKELEIHGTAYAVELEDSHRNGIAFY